MTSDFTGENGSPDPGLEQLFRVLTDGPVAGELAGEQATLAMFRANVRPSPAPPKSVRPSVRPIRWGVRLAAAATLVLGGGMTAAAYASALPAPVQRLAHSVFDFAGVPAVRPVHQVSQSGSSAHHSAGQAGNHPGGQSGPRPAASGRTSPTPSKSGSATPAASPSASPTPSSSASAPPAGPAAMTATVPGGEITAGSQAVISGQFTRAGTGVSGVTVVLIERTAGQLHGHVVGTGTTSADGSVSISVPSVVANSVFRLVVPGVAHSPKVRVVVVPPIDAVLQAMPSGVKDALLVSTQYAHRGNVVELQVESSAGGWVDLRSRRLNGAGRCRFVLDRGHLADRDIRVLLLATVRHGGSASTPQPVPPPA